MASRRCSSRAHQADSSRIISWLFSKPPQVSTTALRALTAIDRSRPLRADAENFLADVVLDQLPARRLVQNGDGALLDQTLEQFPGVGIAIGRSIVEFVHAVRAGQVGKLDADRRMLVLLRIAAEACEPGIVLAHLLRPHLRHRFRHGEGAAQRGQIGDGLVDRGCIQISLASDARIAAFLAFRRLLQNDDLGPEIVRGDRGGHPAAPKPTTTTSASTSQESGIRTLLRSAMHQRDCFASDFLAMTRRAGPPWRSFVAISPIPCAQPRLTWQDYRRRLKFQGSFTHER